MWSSYNLIDKPPYISMPGIRFGGSGDEILTFVVVIGRVIKSPQTISFLAYQVKRLPCGTVSTAQQGPVLMTFVLPKVSVS